MIDTRTIARIKAAQGLASIRDTARYYNVSVGFVSEVWSGKRHTHVKPVREPDPVPNKRIHPDILATDGRILLRRGLSMGAAAKKLGVSQATLYNALMGGR